MKLVRVGVQSRIFGARVLEQGASLPPQASHPPSPLPSPTSSVRFDFDADFEIQDAGESQFPPLSALADSPSFDTEIFLRILALCHTVVVEETQENEDAGDSFEVR